MSNDNKTLAAVQPGGRVRLGDQAERARFEKWMTDVAKIIVGSSDPYPAGLERDYWRVWQAALSAQPSPGGQGAHNPLSVYADSYRRMAKMGDGRVSCIDVAFDIEHNMSRALSARQPVGEPPMEMRICELRHVSLKPNRPYIFTVDANCANCRADAAYAMGQTDNPPAQAVDLGQFRDVVADWRDRCCQAADKNTIVNMAKANRLLALIDKAVGNG